MALQRFLKNIIDHYKEHSPILRNEVMKGYDREGLLLPSDFMDHPDLGLGYVASRQGHIKPGRINMVDPQYTPFDFKDYPRSFEAFRRFLLHPNIQFAGQIPGQGLPHDWRTSQLYNLEGPSILEIPSIEGLWWDFGKRTAARRLTENPEFVEKAYSLLYEVPSVDALPILRDYSDEWWARDRASISQEGRDWRSYLK